MYAPFRHAHVLTLAVLIASCGTPSRDGDRASATASSPGPGKAAPSTAPSIDQPARAHPQDSSPAANQEPSPTAALRDAGAPASLEQGLALLEQRDLGAIAEILRSRVDQKSPKMKLTADQARDAAASVLALTPALDNGPALAGTMPHSTIELARAVAERGVTREDADEIAAYLLALDRVLQFDNLRRLDINHSHVIGRTWPEIDYSGENMTWQGQKAYWQPKGVIDFKKAKHIHAYFRQAYALPHFSRVYKPKGDIADLEWPEGTAREGAIGP